MTILDRYLAKQFAITFFKATMTLIAMYILVDLLVKRVQLIEKLDIPWRVVFTYYGALLPFIVSQYVAPFAILIAGFFVFGESAQHNEVTAALSSGISLKRFVQMPIFVSISIAIGIFLLQETIGILGFQYADNIEQKFFSGSANLRRSPVTWANLEGGWTCHILKFNRIALTGENVVLYAQQPDKQTLIEAQRIYWDENQKKWFLVRGKQYEFDPVSQRRTTHRITLVAAPFTQSPEQLFSLEQAAEKKTLKQLYHDLSYARSRGMFSAGLEVKFYSRFAQPALIVAMAILSIPFAMRLRRGGFAVSFGAAVVVAMIYLMLFFVSTGLGQMGKIPGFVAAALPCMVFLCFSLFLVVKTPT